jgi:hypothetical protein
MRELLRFQRGTALWRCLFVIAMGNGFASARSTSIQAQQPTGAAKDSSASTSAKKLAERLESFTKRDTARSKAAASTTAAVDDTSDAALLPARAGLTGIRSLDSASAIQYAAAWRAYYEYKVSGLTHRRAVFEWQLFSSRVIFWIVIALVASGIAFSGIQFRVSLEAARAARARALAQLARVGATGSAALTPAERDEVLAAQASSLGLDTSLEASAQGLKVSSPVLGVIILSLSLLFFYLYLNFVYPIHESI